MQTLTIQQHLLKEIEYPSRYRRECLFKTVSIQFVLIFIFLLLFKPFGVYEPEHKFSYALICGLHAFFPSLIIYGYFSVLSYAKKKDLSRWTLLQEYAHLAIVFLITGLASFLLRGFIYNNPDNWSWRYLGEEVRNCYLAGILFYIFLLFAGSYFQSNKESVSVDLPLAEVKKSKPDESDAELFIKTQVQQDNFSFNPAHLLFAKADGNYTELTICTGNGVTTELKRISLKQFEAQLNAYPFLLRCHRAYLVNLLQVKKASGNAQGYVLSLNMTEENVPVSRTQVETFDSRYEQLNCIASN